MQEHIQKRVEAYTVEFKRNIQNKINGLFAETWAHESEQNGCSVEEQRIVGVAELL